jgi:hypothetical protein
MCYYGADFISLSRFKHLIELVVFNKLAKNGIEKLVKIGSNKQDEFVSSQDPTQTKIGKK